MKRLSIVLAIVLFCVFSFTNLCHAVPNLVGTWSANIKKITFTGCYITGIQMVVVEQCNNLFRGVITYGGYNYDFTGEIVWDANRKINDIRINARHNLDEYIGFYGSYKSNPPRIVNSNSFYASVDNESKTGAKYDIFSLVKVN